jgi:DNA polymerase III subunit epsilon
MRQIVLDTETTGIDPRDGHRIVEIGAVELENRQTTGRTYHQYLNPERQMDEEVMRVHGISNERVAQEPKFSEVVHEFMQFVQGAELLIHNAPFDLGHINAELSRLTNNPWGKLEDHVIITDTLALAKKSYPGQRNSLDALCKRLFIDNSARTFHGALLDSQILADVYLAMTGGQTGLSLFNDQSNGNAESGYVAIEASLAEALPAFELTNEQLIAHQTMLTTMQKKVCVWTESYPESLQLGG